MNIDVDLSSAKTIKPHEYLVRFVAGGSITAAAGLIAHRFGPTIGGLFLAFPAILSASTTLIATHEKIRKRQAGFDGTRRGRAAAAIDAAGASLGALALCIFGLVVWRLLPNHSAMLTLTLATAAWLLTAVTLWHFGRRF